MTEKPCSFNNFRSLFTGGTTSTSHTNTNNAPPLVPVQPETTTLNVNLGTDCKTFTVPKNASYKDVASTIKESFGINSKSTISIKCENNNGDMFNLASDCHLKKAYRSTDDKDQLRLVVKGIVYNMLGQSSHSAIEVNSYAPLSNGGASVMQASQPAPNFFKKETVMLNANMQPTTSSLSNTISPLIHTPPTSVPTNTTALHRLPTPCSNSSAMGTTSSFFRSGPATYSPLLHQQQKPGGSLIGLSSTFSTLSIKKSNPIELGSYNKHSNTSSPITSKAPSPVSSKTHLPNPLVSSSIFSPLHNKYNQCPLYYQKTTTDQQQQSSQDTKTTSEPTTAPVPPTTKLNRNESFEFMDMMENDDSSRQPQPQCKEVAAFIGEITKMFYNLRFANDPEEQKALKQKICSTIQGTLSTMPFIIGMFPQLKQFAAGQCPGDALLSVPPNTPPPSPSASPLADMTSRSQACIFPVPGDLSHNDLQSHLNLRTKIEALMTADSETEMSKAHHGPHHHQSGAAPSPKSPTMRNTLAKVIDGPTIHKGTTCTLCSQSPIVGNLYHCAICTAFTFCELFTKAMKACNLYNTSPSSLSTTSSSPRRGCPYNRRRFKCNFNLRFLTDITLPFGSEVHPGDRLTKTWRIQNTGIQLPKDCILVRVCGNTRLSTVQTVALPSIPSSEVFHVSVPIQIPDI
eukprot:gene13318-15658_t